MQFIYNDRVGFCSSAATPAQRLCVGSRSRLCWHYPKGATACISRRLRFSGPMRSSCSASSATHSPAPCALRRCSLWRRAFGSCCDSCKAFCSHRLNSCFHLLHESRCTRTVLYGHMYEYKCIQWSIDVLLATHVSINHEQPIHKCTVLRWGLLVNSLIITVNHLGAEGEPYWTRAARLSVWPHVECVRPPQAAFKPCERQPPHSSISGSCCQPPLCKRFLTALPIEPPPESLRSLSGCWLAAGPLQALGRRFLPALWAPHFISRNYWYE